MSGQLLEGDELCRNCGKRRTGSRGRGLCWTCFYTPGVRVGYSANGARERTHRGLAGDNKGVTAPSRATGAPPGSRAKIEELARRAAAGEGLWHADDWTDDDLGTGQPVKVLATVPGQRGLGEPIGNKRRRQAAGIKAVPRAGDHVPWSDRRIPRQEGELLKSLRVGEHVPGGEGEVA